MSTTVKAKLYLGKVLGWQPFNIYNRFSYNNRLDEQLNSGEFEIRLTTDYENLLFKYFAPYTPVIIEAADTNFPPKAAAFPAFSAQDIPYSKYTRTIVGGSNRKAYLEVTNIEIPENMNVYIDGIEAENYSDKITIYDTITDGYGNARFSYSAEYKTIDGKKYIQLQTMVNVEDYGESVYPYEAQEKKVTLRFVPKALDNIEGYAFDTTQKNGANNTAHILSFVEPTKVLEGIYLDGMSVTQPENENDKQSLADVLTRLLAITPLRIAGQDPIYTFADISGIGILSQIKAPQFSWSSRTSLWEALKDIGAYIDAIPRLTLNDEKTAFTKIVFDNVNEIAETLDRLEYVSMASGTSMEQVTSSLETEIENILSDYSENNVEYYPSKDTYITPRAENYVLTTESSSIILPKPIYKINKVTVLTSTLGKLKDGITSKELPIKAAEIDITDFIVESNVAKTLPARPSYSKFVFGFKIDVDKFKNNTLPYEQGNNIIALDGSETYHFLWDEQTRVEAMLTSAATKVFLEENPNYDPLTDGEYNGFSLYPDVRGLKLKVEYVPVVERLKMRATKQALQSYQMLQTFNQRAEVNSAEAFGRNMLSTVQKMGAISNTRANFYKKATDIPVVGSLYEDLGDSYIIVSNEIEISSPEYIKVIHTLSQNWSLLSQYVGIDRKYRSTPIPMDFIDRNLFYEDYCIVADKPIKAEHRNALLNDTAFCTTAESQRFFFPETTTDYIVKNIYFYKPLAGDALNGAVMWSFNFATANSLIFNCRTENNLSVAQKQVTSDDDGLTYGEDVFYSNEDGTLDKMNICVAFGDIDFSTYNANAVPQSISGRVSRINSPNEYYFLKEFDVKKDARERFSFTYQLHYVSPLPAIIFGRKFAETSPLIYNKAKTFRYWKLYKKLPYMTVKIPENWNAAYKTLSSDSSAENWVGNYFTVNTQGSGTATYWYLRINTEKQDLSAAVGWAITDQDNNLLLACNDKDITTLYFNYCHEYHGKQLEYE